MKIIKKHNVLDWMKSEEYFIIYLILWDQHLYTQLYIETLELLSLTWQCKCQLILFLNQLTNLTPTTSTCHPRVWSPHTSALTTSTCPITLPSRVFFNIPTTTSETTPHARPIKHLTGGLCPVTANLV